MGTEIELIPMGNLSAKSNGHTTPRFDSLTLLEDRA